MTKDPRVEKLIEDNSRVLGQLLKEVNAKRDEIDELEEIYTERTQEASRKFLARLEEHETKLKDPGKSITLLYEEMEEREKFLQGWENELNEISGEIEGTEDVLDEKEQVLATQRGEIDELRMKAIQTVQDRLIQTKRILEKRIQGQDERAKRLERDRIMLRDRLSTLKAAEIEILGNK